MSTERRWIDRPLPTNRDGKLFAYAAGRHADGPDVHDIGATADENGSRFERRGRSGISTHIQDQRKRGFYGGDGWTNAHYELGVGLVICVVASQR